MTFIFRSALACLLVAGSSGAGLSAQTTRSRPAVPPAASAQAQDDQPPVERTPVEPESDRGRERFHRPIFRGLQDYTLATGDVVRDVRTLFGDVTIEGRVEQDVVVIMGSARMGSTAVIERSLVVVGGSADVAAGASIGGDLVVIGGTLTAPSAFSPDGEHVVIGSAWLAEALRDVLPWVTRGVVWGRLIVPDMAWIWAVVAVFFLVYLVFNTVFDRAVGATADVLGERPLSAFVGGLLVLLLAIPGLVIVAASVVGLAVIPFLLCGLVVAGLIGKTAAARAIGRSVIRTESPEGRIAAFFAFTLGFGLLTLAYMVPVLGFVTWALASVLGLGASTATFRAHLRRERRTAAGAPGVAAAAAASPGVALDGPADLPAPEHAPVPPVDPPLAAPLFNLGLAGYPRATFLDRLAAFALDCILVAIANGLLDMQRHDGFFFLLLLAYHIAFWAWKGTTLGGIICNLRVTRTDGAPPRFADAMVRGLSSIFSIAAVGIGCLWMLQDPERQMWHDKIAGTLVVKVPRHIALP